MKIILNTNLNVFLKKFKNSELEEFMRNIVLNVNDGIVAITALVNDWKSLAVRRYHERIIFIFKSVINYNVCIFYFSFLGAVIYCLEGSIFMVLTTLYI